MQKPTHKTFQVKEKSSYMFHMLSFTIVTNFRACECVRGFGPL